MIHVENYGFDRFHNVERMHPCQRGRTSITGLVLKRREIIETGRLLGVAWRGIASSWFGGPQLVTSQGIDQLNSMNKPSNTKGTVVITNPALNKNGSPSRDTPRRSVKPDRTWTMASATPKRIEKTAYPVVSSTTPK